MTPSAFDQTISSISLVIIGIGLTYFFLCMGSGVLHLWRAGGLGSQDGHRYGENEDGVDPVDADLADLCLAYDVYFLVPCLNEEAVIGTTVRGLLQNPNSRVIVIDDASDDRTAEIAREEGQGRALVLSRTLPNARLGKGPALNAAFELVKADVAERELDTKQVLICVMDADGRLSRDAVSVVAPLFDDPEVGGVQLAVRIRNKHQLITRVQDFEFWGLSATSQFGRVSTGTVSLGGNGQFTRLSALLALDDDPWSTSLTEDLDLAITMLLAGWKLTTTPLASVEQQAVDSLKRLVKQRTRWFQGHMTCGKRLGDVWKSPDLSHSACIEVSLYLLVPWLLVLPWSIVFHIGLYEMIRHAVDGSNSLVLGSNLLSRVVYVFTWYALSFFPSIVSGMLYYRREKACSLPKAYLVGHALVLGNYLAYTACWRAFFRMLRGKDGWDKTSRSSEPAVPIAAPVVAGAGGV
jgi:cellulose synthase/poly-beta-1,6-N-acetylglucosamine synthase-like glycosyltransferase